MRMPQVLTANRLASGAVVYWNTAHGWVPQLSEATTFGEDQADAVPAHAGESVSRREVVGPYLFDVRETAGIISPVKEREIIRARGPSVRSDHSDPTHVSL
jgi:Protein of unknown function (DUF2849)